MSEGKGDQKKNGGSGVGGFLTFGAFIAAATFGVGYLFSSDAPPPDAGAPQKVAASSAQTGAAKAPEAIKVAAKAPAAAAEAVKVAAKAPEKVVETVKAAAKAPAAAVEAVKVAAKAPEKVVETVKAAAKAPAAAVEAVKIAAKAPAAAVETVKIAAKAPTAAAETVKIAAKAPADEDNKTAKMITTAGVGTIGAAASGVAAHAGAVAHSAVLGRKINRGNYEQARWHPIHFQPMINTATNEQCLACHQEVLQNKVRETSPAGVKAANSLAWYQTLDTYKGPQMTFHQRHLTSKFANQVMDLKCNFCHQGNDPREEVPNTHKENYGDTSHAMRKSVVPSKTCLKCHGKFPFEHMEGVEGPWPQARVDLEDETDPDMRNGCMSCHGESYRTVRHQVTYLKPENIEKLAKAGSSDVCYGCHGGRQWYRKSYPYPRHKWPGMEDVVEETPDWAKSRPTESEAKYRRAAK